jgi:predicted NUDIX family NTP pyrophosphohydrolase
MVCPLALTYLQSGYVLAAITLFVLPLAAFWFLRSGGAWNEIGKGRFGVMHSMAPPRMAQPSPEIDLAIQAAEARQMIEAKSYRRVKRGEEPLDVEAEVSALLDSELSGRAGGKRNLDEKLRAEVRDLVVARNERRMRRGQEPLDVEAEVERQVADFIGLGS